MTVEARVSEIPQESIIKYPIGAEAVIAVVKPLFASPEPAWDEYLDLKAPMLETENPYANGYLMAIGNNFSGLENQGFRIGITLAYEIFKERADKQKIPTLNLEFVQAYDAFMHDRLISVYGKYLGSLISGADREEETRRGLFVMLEKDTYQALDEEMTGQNESIFENHVFLGFVSSYFLFRQGFSDPDFWESD